MSYDVKPCVSIQRTLGFVIAEHQSPASIKTLCSNLWAGDSLFHENIGGQG